MVTFQRVKLCNYLYKYVFWWRSGVFIQEKCLSATVFVVMLSNFVLIN